MYTDGLNEAVISESNRSLPVVVIGAGPVGLAAAAHLQERGIAFEVFEAGSAIASNIAEWGHVRLFTPWKYLTDRAAVRLLERHRWSVPNPEDLPTGHELIDRYLQPLADTPEIATRLRFGWRVLSVARLGIDKVKASGRVESPFVLRIEKSSGEQTDVLAAAVIDASGTWATPNPLGAGGLSALGEAAMEDRIAYGIPDVTGSERHVYEGRNTLVVGAGHSAANTILELLALGASDGNTSVTWAVRGHNLASVFGGGDADALPARGQLGSRLRAAAETGALTLLSDFAVESIEIGSDGRVRVRSAAGSSVDVDNVVAATGQRPDLDLARELRLDLDPRLESPRQLAPLIDPNVHSCGSVPPHGFDLLSHPETGFFVVGIKSYGRAPTFLMMTGYEQVRSIVAALDGDFEAARNLELVLPETGVCSTDVPGPGILSGGADLDIACCGSDSNAKGELDLSVAL